jgi:hypothetical protein
MGTRVVAIVAALMVAGCSPQRESFTCMGDSSCGVGGKCEPGFNLCSFPDSSCPDGRSFGGLGGPNAGQCVGSTPPPDGGHPDVPPDARACFGTGLVQFCLAKAPTQPFTTADLTTIDTGDTSAGSKCAPLASVTSGGTFCVISATSINLNGTLRATGSKPLVLLSTSSITTAASAAIDVGSHRVHGIGAPETGAGANPGGAVCGAGTAPTSGGGGAGGSFTGLGGNGGNGNNLANTGGTPGPVVTTTSELRGGCPGQDGQGGIVERGVHGSGGGAVFLIALDRLDIAGGIDAGGESGAAGITNASGGGGGGAGGMIGFDAPTINVTSLLLANGGAGGEGSGQTGAGKDGADATATAAAKGGAGNSGTGGDGGDGSAGAAAGPGSTGQTGSNGGGGGGGGAGLIKAPNGASLGNMVSPAATQP